MAQSTARVLAVLELLQAHGQISGAELARRLEVNGRTLRRYIATLEAIGIPITAERGRSGGYSLITGFKLPPMMFTEDEALAVSLGLEAARSLGLAQAAPAVAGAQAKLERVMPPNLRQRVRAISETTTMELAAAGTVANSTTLAQLTSAAQAKRRVRLVYRAGNDEQSEREFDPYGLIYRTGHWYVTGFCHLRRDLRSFRVDRIHQVHGLDSLFERPTDFDAAAYLSTSIASIPRAMKFKVFLHTDLATAMSEIHSSLGMLEAVDGGVMLHASAEGPNWFARRLSSLPFEIDILEPEELRVALRAHAAALLARISN